MRNNASRPNRESASRPHRDVLRATHTRTFTSGPQAFYFLRTGILQVQIYGPRLFEGKVPKKQGP